MDLKFTMRFSSEKDELGKQVNMIKGKFTDFGEHTIIKHWEQFIFRRTTGLPLKKCFGSCGKEVAMC